MIPSLFSFLLVILGGLVSRQLHSSSPGELPLSPLSFISFGDHWLTCLSPQAWTNISLHSAVFPSFIPASSALYQSSFIISHALTPRKEKTQDYNRPRYHSSHQRLHQPFKMAAFYYANGSETNRIPKFRFYIHGETATSSKNVQSEVREVEKVLHKHTHPERFPELIFFFIQDLMITFDLVGRFLTQAYFPHAFFLIQLLLKGQITDVLIGLISETLRWDRWCAGMELCLGSLWCRTVKFYSLVWFHQSLHPDYCLHTVMILWALLSLQRSTI